MDHQFRFFIVDQQQQALVAQIVDSQLQGETVAEFLKLELLKIVETLSPTVVVVDFRNVNIIGTSVISCFLFVNSRLAGQGVRLKLSAMSDPLRQIFRTLQLDGSVFQIFDTTEQAVASPSGPTTYEDVCGRPTPFDLDSSD